MYPPQGDLEIEQSEVQLSELKNRSALKIMIFEGTKDEVEESVKNLMNSILNKIDLESKEEDCKVCVETFLDKCTTKNVYSKEPVILGELKDFDEKVIKLSRNQIVKLACDTLVQSECDEWFNSRYLRISASKKAYCIKSGVKKTVESLIGDMLFPKKLDISATIYGREHESKARVMYKSLFNVNVMNVGVVVSEKQPWLCASLDGVVIEDSKITKIVEIKCPSSCEKKSIVDFSTETCNVPYLKFNGNKAELRESTAYYIQCQVQMYISVLDLCDLFIYIPVQNGSICIAVKRNEIFLSNTVIKCEKFSSCIAGKSANG
ncbi:hypothetical protein JTB14_025697 [Gonioctena quinquepunctata]|nr:hypothetical protein JTB14_025697 [Gonioctena quinquepunctata]